MWLRNRSAGLLHQQQRSQYKIFPTTEASDEYFRLITTMHYPSLFLAAFAGLATANIDLSPQPSMLNAGDVRNVSWTIDRPYVSCPHHWSLVSH